MAQAALSLVADKIYIHISDLQYIIHTRTNLTDIYTYEIISGIRTMYCFPKMNRMAMCGLLYTVHSSSLPRRRRLVEEQTK